jgi:hypothetical protein
MVTHEERKKKEGKRKKGEGLICAGEQRGEKGRKEKKNLKERSVLLVCVSHCLLMGITSK